MAPLPSYKDLWPTDDSTWDSPKDVVLVLHLATLASGYTPNINLAARPTPTRTSHAFLRCVEPKKPHRTGCQATLLYLEYLTRSKKGNGPCKVHLPPRSKDTQKLCDHHGGEDSGHSECVGPLERATSPFHLSVGTRVYTKREVSLIEAGLKSTGRRAGYAIQSRHTKDVLVKCLGESDAGPCKWQVRLIPGKGRDGEGNEVEGHTASEIDPVHQCEPKLPSPSEPLREVLDYFPEITLTAGLIGKSKRQQVRKKPKGKTPATPDYATDSSDEEGVISDSGLQRRCEELIALCPPKAESNGNGPADPSSLEAPANASGPASATGSIEHTTLTAPASALGLSSAAASPSAGGGRDTRDPSSSLSPVQSEAADDSMYEEPALVDAGAEDDEDDGSYGGDSEEEKPRASKRARLARGQQLQQEEQQRRATRRSLGKGKEVSYKEVWEVEGLDDEEEKPEVYEGAVEQPTIEDLKPIEDVKPVQEQYEDVKPQQSVPAPLPLGLNDDSIIPDSAAPSPAVASSSSFAQAQAHDASIDPTLGISLPTAAHLASTAPAPAPAPAVEAEPEVDLSMFVDLDSSAPATQENDKVGEVVEGGEHKIVVDQMLPSAEVEEKIGMEVDA
ncbi:hypothetical protein BCR35DRAFT_303996 [Leucosporidium creatinivorum]|uniref:Uncharacterized protein n=1 Tax=Leucosporidium creatinivorum TaxID=106004 RepID=A0A1Y2FDX6_9BASI|nr:hypothetical protein BCR35DRAFT_303996 [Leucosporidium creatinivorum]